MQLEIPFPKDNVVVSLSGGMDSSTLLLRCLKEYKNVVAVSFDYGQKHRVELERAQSLIDYINANPCRIFHHDHAPNGFEETYSLVNYHVIELNGLSGLLNSTLVHGGTEVPEGHYAEENMKSTVVPNRNKIFSSIIQAIALSIATQRNQECDIALGVHSGDHFIYPDCREEFRDADYDAFRKGNWDSHLVKYFTPYLQGNKYTILKDGEDLCKDLRLNFDEVYSRTNTSYKPILLEVDSNTPGSTVMNVGMWNQGYYKWYSDYKSASSVERIEAFLRLRRKDPINYADETGPVSWEVAKKHVEQLIYEREG
jgi:7-cyano-7-deazaguanine synthase